VGRESTCCARADADNKITIDPNAKIVASLP
jgi:hypothetical protein